MATRIESELGVEVVLVPIQTTGDRIQDVSLAKVGGKGLFVKEIEEALLDGRADIAVHSAKDLPAAVPQGLSFVAFPERADPRDALVGREPGATLADLPAGARVGTGSVRRVALLRAYRPDLEIVPLRGNVPTRLRKIEEQSLDAVVLASAGLDRLGLSDRIGERISTDVMLPAVGQGILAIEGRSDDSISRDVSALACANAEASAAAERAFLIGLAGDCNVPLAALAEPDGQGGLRLRALLASLDGARLLTHDVNVSVEDGVAAGEAAAAAILGAGGEAILAELHEEAQE
jgi:hydroxymethylbilane synthase